VTRRTAVIVPCDGNVMRLSRP